MNKNELIKAYQIASKRLLLLDYDGVLAPIMSLPEQAAPSQETRALLEKLAADTRNECVIISGRQRETLEEWLGDLPLAFAAEHGLWRRGPHGDWELAVESKATAWKQVVRNTMTRYELQMPGSFIEEKYASVGIHYRNVAGETAGVIRSLIDDLRTIAVDYSLTILDGKKVVEVIPAGVDKGSAAKFWLDAKGWGFILAAGDDVTDEALFEVLSTKAYSVKVGEGRTHAKMRVSSQAEFIDLLEVLARHN